MESCGGETRCDCQCGISVGKKGVTDVKDDWKENHLRRTLMAFRHAYIEEERTGVLKQPSLADILTAWDLRKPSWTEEDDCPICQDESHPSAHPDISAIAESSQFYMKVSN